MCIMESSCFRLCSLAFIVFVWSVKCRYVECMFPLGVLHVRQFADYINRQYGSSNNNMMCGKVGLNNNIELS